MPKSSVNASLSSYDDIFSTEESRQEEQREQVRQIPIGELFPFKNHPFKVLDDDSMSDTVESVKQYGVLSPLIARPRPKGGYEIISGHRRQHAAELAGLETLPVIVRQMDDDAAIILMVDSNLQREHSDSGEGGSNWLSRWRQKQDVRKSYYAAARSGGTAAQTAGGQKITSSGASATKSGVEQVIDKGKSAVSTAVNGIANFAKSNAHVLVIVGVFLLLLLLVMSAFSSCSILFSGTTQVSGQTIYTAEDRDIRGAETDYKKLEKELDKKIKRTPTDHPGYDEFASMRELNRRGKTPDPEHYEVTYYADLPAMWQDVPNNEVLEELFQMFNLSRPQDFEGHSLSVSDVIALKRNGEVSVHYVDSIGFKDLQGFLDKQPERPSVLLNLKEKCDAPECNPTVCRKARDVHEL